MSIWRRVLWTIQLVVFVTAGLFVTPIAGRVQNATGQAVASATHTAERVVASRERSGERASRLRTDQSGAPLAFSPPALPIIARASFFVQSPSAHREPAPRHLRFEPYAPRGPPQQG